MTPNTSLDTNAPDGRRPSRRRFLRTALSGTGLLLLAACAPATPAPTAAPARPADAPKPTDAPKPAGASKPADAAKPAASPAAAAPAAPVVQPTAAPAVLKAPADKRALIIGNSADITHLDPHMSTSTNNIVVTWNIFDNLTTRDPDLKLQPQLATEWKTLDDTTWEFKLRPNVKFHNGDPFTSEDAKFSIERTYDPEAKTLVTTLYTTIDRIETPDPLTIRFLTKKPDPLIPARMATFGGQILPAKYLKSVGPDGFRDRPVGSGPVKFKEWIRGERLALDANREYWGGPPDFDSAIFRPLSENAPRIASLLAGETDLITRLPADQIQRVNSSGKTRAEGSFFSGLYVLAVNSKVPPLDNPKVKQALSLAIDRDTIVKTLWRNQGIVPNGPIAKGDTVGYDEARPPLEYNQDKARALLKEAGYANEPVIIETTDGLVQSDKLMAEAITEMWRKVGVNAQMEIIEVSVRSQKYADKSFKGLFWSDPTSTLQDPDGMMWRLLAPGAPQHYWNDPEFNRLGEEARFSLDQKLRDQNYKKMTDIFLQHFPWLPIIQPVESYGVQGYLQWRANPGQRVELRNDVLKFNR